MKALIVLLMLSVAFSAVTAEPAFAKSQCRKKFESNLLRIKSLACGKLSRRCWSAVKKGRSNSSQILSQCSDREVNTAKEMERFSDRNVSVCNSGCSELKRKGVCIDGLSKRTYYRRLGLASGCI